MSTLRERIVQEARGWLGTPYQHQQRLRGVGVDCVGLLVGVARTLGLVAADFDVRGYSRQPDGQLMARAGELLVRIDVAAMQAGDVVVMRFEQDPCHLAILADYPVVAGQLSIIHALTTRAGGGRVVEHRLDATNMAKVMGAFQFPGVAQCS